MSTFAALRALAAVTIAPVVAWSLHYLFRNAQSLLDLSSPDWPFLLTSVYGNLIVGFVFAGVAAKFAPALNQTFIWLTIGGSILVGFGLALTSDYGLVLEAGLGVALVLGAAGYALRLRGFSEAATLD